MYKSPFHFLVIFYLNLFIPFSYAAPPLACSNDYANDLRVNELNVAGSTANANNSGEGYIELYVLQPIILNNKTISYFNNGQLAPAVSLNTINAKVYLPDGSSQTANNYSNSVVPVNSFIVYPENLFSSSTAFTKNSGEILILDTTSNTVIHYFNYSNNNPGSKWDVADSSPSCKTSFDPGNADDNGICSKPDGSNTWAICNASEGTSNDDNGGGGSSNDCTSFSFDIPTLTACKPASSIAINCGSDLQGDQTFKLWSTYSAPSSGSEQVKVNDTIISTSSPGTGITLNFTDGSASFDIQYDDAGQVKLDASFDNNGSLISSDSTFISKPAALVTYNEDANADCATADASCSVFKKAGETFNLKVKAVCWDDDADYSNNPVTANFELVNIPINHTLVAPAGGNSGSISTSSFNFSSSDNGIHTVSQSVSEVGVFTFDTSPPNYFGQTLSTVSSSEIGRFTPDHFALSNKSIENRVNLPCSPASSFTYTGEAFQTGFTLTAQNSSNATTQNYTGSFTKLDNSVISNFNFGAIDLADATAPLSATALTSDLSLVSSSGSWSNGVATITASLGLTRTTPNGPFESFNLGIAPTDSDGIILSSYDLDTSSPSDSNDRELLASTKIRFGRLNIENAYGSELLALSVPLYTEYYNGTSFIKNTADACTTATVSQLNFNGGSNPITVGSGTSTASITNSPLVLGLAGLSLSAPGSGNTGDVDITSTSFISSFPWLAYDWNGDGTHDNAPSARATFGIYKGNSNQIYFREVY